MTVAADQLRDRVTELAGDLKVPGVAVGVLVDGREHHVFHGVTSVENPLAIDERTLFQMGSTTKTYTATAIMRLVEDGRVQLAAPVRSYVPELNLEDPDVAAKVTVLHLLNHTAGWEGDLIEFTHGEGDDALERYVRRMATLPQVTPLGTAASYNNAAFSLAGLVIQRVTGETYEQALRELLFEPLGLEQSYFFPNDIMTRRFAVGHNQQSDGSITVARPWALPRSGNPAGGIASTSADLIAWARFHLGDGHGPDGRRVLSEETLRSMREPTFDTRGADLGDAIGISWMLREVDGARLVSHGGDTLGQHSDFVLIPGYGFAISTLTNCGPNGGQFNEDIVRWALETYLGVVWRDPEPVARDAGVLAVYAGRYETIAAAIDISVDGGGLQAKVALKPGFLEQLREAGGDEPPDQPPFPLGLLPGEGDRYIVTGGDAKGMKGYFVRDRSGAIESIHVGGRLATRTAPVAPGRS